MKSGLWLEPEVAGVIPPSPCRSGLVLRASSQESSEELTLSCSNKPRIHRSGKLHEADKRDVLTSIEFS